MRYKLLLIATILLHYAVFIAFLFTAVVAFFTFPWYIALSLEALITRVIFDNTNVCPLTLLENWTIVRMRGTKYRPSHGFLRDYLLNIHKRLPYIIYDLLLSDVL